MSDDFTDINLEESEEAKQLEDIEEWLKDPTSDEKYISLPLNLYLDDEEYGLDRWINLNFNFNKASLDEFRKIKRLFKGLGECIQKRPNLQNLPECEYSNSQVLRYAIGLNQTKEETEQKQWKYSLWTVEFLRKVSKSCQRLLKDEFHPDNYAYVSSDNETLDKKEDKDVVTEEDGNKFKNDSATQWTKCFNTVRDTLIMCMEIMKKQRKNDMNALALPSSSTSSPTFSSTLLSPKCSSIATIHEDDNTLYNTLSSLSSSSSSSTSSCSSSAIRSLLLSPNTPYYSPIIDAIAEGRHMEVRDNGFRLQPLKHVLAAFYTTFPTPLQEAFRRCSWQPTSKTWLDDTTPLDFIEVQIGLRNSSSSSLSFTTNSNKKINLNVQNLPTQLNSSELKTVSLSISSSSSSSTSFTSTAAPLSTSIVSSGKRKRPSSTHIMKSVDTESTEETQRKKRKSKRKRHKQCKINDYFENDSITLPTTYLGKKVKIVGINHNNHPSSISGATALSDSKIASVLPSSSLFSSASSLAGSLLDSSDTKTASTITSSRSLDSSNFNTTTSPTSDPEKISNKGEKKEKEIKEIMIGIRENISAGTSKYWKWVYEYLSTEKNRNKWILRSTVERSACRKYREKGENFRGAIQLKGHECQATIKEDTAKSDSILMKKMGKRLWMFYKS